MAPRSRRMRPSGGGAAVTTGLAETEGSVGPVRLERDSAIAVVVIDNPPVNASSWEVRRGLLDAVRQIAVDETLAAAVLIGAGRNFMAGADIREFDGPLRDPQSPAVIEAIESCPKPFVAAIRGAALGGGFELALGCDARVATPDAVVGLPEVTLGIIPGAGGTQRLPRLVGMEAAIDIITSGRRVDASEALKLGIADALAEGDLLTSARDFLAAKIGAPPPRLADRPLAAPAVEIFTQARKQVAARARGQKSPLSALDLLAETAQSDFAQGMAREAEVFGELRNSMQ